MLELDYRIIVIITAGTAPMKGPKYGIILVIPTIILKSNPYRTPNINIPTKQMMPMINESMDLPIIYLENTSSISLIKSKNCSVRFHQNKHSPFYE